MADFHNEILIESTHKSPLIKGNIKEGTLLIQGKSIPEDAKQFYLPLLSWVLEFENSPAEKIEVTADLEYFNTSTSSILLSLFKIIEKLNDKKPASIKWIFEEDDLDMEEVGEDYQLMLPNMITMVSKPSHV